MYWFAVALIIHAAITITIVLNVLSVSVIITCTVVRGYGTLVLTKIAAADAAVSSLLGITITVNIRLDMIVANTASFIAGGVQVHTRQ